MAPSWMIGLSRTQATKLALLFLLEFAIDLSHSTVSPEQLSKLSRGQLLRLDNEVSEFYLDSYADLERKNITFNEQIYRAIRATRHTNVVNIFDFRYTNNATKWNSMGSKVDRELCKVHLNALVDFIDGSKSPLDLPLSVVDFLSASGSTESGFLNGNFVWLGSSSSCKRANIGAQTVAKFRHIERAQHTGFRVGVKWNETREGDITGRYCVAHLRAKSWPKWDIYFEDRITIRRGLCLPEACHTALHDDDAQIRQLVAILARANLAAPFNDERQFEVSHLYCLPDEDSEFRRLDLGAKLFLVFVGLWGLLTLWVNIKYSSRANAIKQLRQAIDIRMIIDRDDGDDDDDDDGPSSTSEFLLAPQHSGRQLKSATTGSKKNETTTTTTTTKTDGGEFCAHLLRPTSASACSSAAVTPLPSDFEDNDDNYANLMEPFKSSSRAANSSKRRRKSSKKTSRVQTDDDGDGDGDELNGGEPSPSVDFVRALSIEANLYHLLYRRRPNRVRSQLDNSHHHQAAQDSNGGSGGGEKLLRSAASLLGRRSSSSNEALVKDLQRNELGESKVAIEWANEAALEDKRGQSGHLGGAKGARVNVEILDGLKVLATSYIVHGHTMMFLFGCVTDMRFGLERMLDFTMIATINALQIVGLFYVITGCLLTYLAFSKAKPRQLMSPLFWLLVLVGRYLRLLPAYALVFWFARHVAPLTGAGRDWFDYRTDEQHSRGHCANESWWIMWTMSAADVKIPNDCVPQAWYLSNDFRTLMVLPVYVYLLARNARLAYAAILATFAASGWKLAHILKAASIDYKILLRWHPHAYALMADRLHHVYTDFLVRISTYLLGVIVGHLLYLYEIGYIRRWPRWFARYGLKLALLVAGGFFLGAPLLASPWINQFLPAPNELDSDTIVWIIPLFKSSMELAICAILLLLMTGAGSELLRQLLASQTMRILSNISYMVFLTHVELLYKLPATKYESNYWYLFIYASFNIVASHLLSFFLHLIWEMPINNLTRGLFKRAFRATA